MVDSKPLIDIHCHLLPGIDDGAADWAEFEAMARLAVDDGIATIVATPHQLGSYSGNDGQTIRQLARVAQNYLDARRIPLGILPGADVRIEPDMIAKTRAGSVLTIAGRGRHLLLELPHELYLPMDRLLADLDRAGLVGVLTHPERNQAIIRRPAILDRLVDLGCLFQITAGSLVGAFGAEIQAFSQSLVSDGLVHFVATDAHGSKSRRPILGQAFDCLCDLAGHDAAEELCCDNPLCATLGDDVAPGRRHWGRGGIRSWWPWRKAG